MSPHGPPLQQLSLQLVTCSLHAVHMQFTCMIHTGSCWSGQCQQQCDKCWSTAAVCAREDGGGHLQGSERHYHGYQQPQNIRSSPAVSDKIARVWVQACCKQHSLSSIILELSRQSAPTSLDWMWQMNVYMRGLCLHAGFSHSVTIDVVPRICLMLSSSAAADSHDLYRPAV